MQQNLDGREGHNGGRIQVPKACHKFLHKSEEEAKGQQPGLAGK